MNNPVMLKRPMDVGFVEDILNPDKYIDALAPAFEGSAERQARFDAVKSLDHSKKVCWLLSLKVVPGQKLSPAVICTTIIVVTIFYVIVGYKIVNGIKQAITEERKKETEKKVCVPADP
jgi:hypothetical protein